jgi:hypothetical protein
MSLKRRAATIGVAGTLAYYLLGYLLMRVTFAINPDANPLPLMLILLPLLPGMIPGGLVALPFGGFHDTSFIVSALVAAPFVNSLFVYVWIKGRYPQKVSK